MTRHHHHPHPHHHGPAAHAAQGHRHAHGAGHDHSHGASEARVGIAALLTALFMFAELAGGLISGSLALLADAGHMLTDCASLGLAWYGFRLARRPADWRRTYGYDRFSVLVAFANGLALFAIAGWIVMEAAHRLQGAPVVLGGIMFWVALGGLVVNIAAFWVLQGGDRNNLNVRAAALHVMGDLLGSVAAIVAAIVIIATGWTPIDPILSVLVALIILRSAWRVVSDSGHILLEGTPSGMDSREIARDLRAAFPAIEDVHHVHAWSITQERPMVTLHVRVVEACQPERIAAEVKQRLMQRFGVAHATVEVEFDACADEGEVQAIT
ncbi:MAG: cation diffusion facilitator family transporter [Rhodomicrobiaceae bacterium]